MCKYLYSWHLSRIIMHRNPSLRHGHIHIIFKLYICIYIQLQECIKNKDKEGAKGLVKVMAPWELKELVDDLEKLGITVNGIYMYV